MENEFNRVFGEKLKYLRTSAKMTQMELAMQLGYDSSGAISQIERGLKGMSKQKIQMVAEIFGIHPALLFTPKKFSHEQIDMALDLMIIISTDKESSYLDPVKSLLKLAANDIKSKQNPKF